MKNNIKTHFKLINFVVYITLFACNMHRNKYMQYRDDVSKKIYAPILWAASQNKIEDFQLPKTIDQNNNIQSYFYYKGLRNLANDNSIDFNVKSPDSQHWTVLFKLAEKGYYESLEFILKNCINRIEIDGEGVEVGLTAVDAAISMENYNCLELLLRYGASPHVYHKNQGSPLYIAAFNNDIKSIRILMKYGADPNIICGINNTPMLYILKKQNIPILKEFLKKPYSCNGTDRNNNSLLFICCNKMLTESAKELLKRDEIDINKGTTKNHSPLWISVFRKNIELIKLLLNNPNIEVNKKDDKNNRSPLYIACEKTNNEIINLLLSHPFIKIDENFVLNYLNRNKIKYYDNDNNAGNEDEKNDDQMDVQDLGNSFFIFSSLANEISYFIIDSIILEGILLLIPGTNVTKLAKIGLKVTQVLKNTRKGKMLVRISGQITKRITRTLLNELKAKFVDSKVKDSDIPKNFKALSDNFLREKGIDNINRFKESFVGKDNIPKFNIYRESITGELILVRTQDLKVFIRTSRVI